MDILRMGSKGEYVRNWQYFLIGRNLLHGEADGVFGDETLSATIAFQMENKMQPDGVVGNKTYGMAMLLGYSGTIDASSDKTSPNYPPPPDFKPLVSEEEKQDLFGQLEYVPYPIEGNPEHIRIVNDWQKVNIHLVEIPQLGKFLSVPKIPFHQKAAPNLIKLWQDWEEAGLLHLVLSWGGSFAPRFIRGSKSKLSQHAFGTAFDINVAWNLIGSVPALVGQKGSVRELVEIANANGFYWGGHFARLDGMHFEVWKIKEYINNLQMT